MSYKGKFITDDYFMVAIASKYSESEFAIRALNAGSSFMIFGHTPNSLRRLNRQKIPVKEFITSLHSQAYQLYKNGTLNYETLRRIEYNR